MANTQHYLRRVRPATVLALGIVASYLLLQLRPRDQLIHAFQELLAADLAIFVLKLGVGKADLTNGVTLFPIGGSVVVVSNPSAFSGGSLVFAID